MGHEVQESSFQYAVRIVKLSKYLREMHGEYTLSKQLLRCGTSIGANVAEAQQAQSKSDFVHKMSIALKEAVETNYWLRLLHATDYLSSQAFDSMSLDCTALEKMLTAIIKTAKNQIAD